MPYNLTIETDRRIQRALREALISGQFTEDGRPIPGTEIYLKVNDVYVEEVPVTDVAGKYEFRRSLPWGHIKLQTQAWIVPYGEERTLVESPIIYIWVIPSPFGLMLGLLGREK